MRGVMVAVMAVACSPNDKAPARPDAHRASDASHDSPAAADALPDSMIDAHMFGSDLVPLAPTTFAWQSLQEQFRHGATTCTGQVTVAVGDRAVCYVGSDDDLHCAGAIYTHDYGSTFTALGQTGVDQILIGLTINSATGNSICVHKRAGSIWCMGDGNSLGQFGIGNKSPTATFAQFGSAATTYTRFGGDWNTHCALDAQGHVWCAGNSVQSSTPVALAGSGHVSFWVDEQGTVNLDSTSVLRASNWSPCTVQADGLHCNAASAQALSGSAGQVVDGGVNQPPGGMAMGDALVCWLDPAGAAHCGASGIQEVVFAAAPPILALATNFYTDARCAVGNDGSLWCIGSNTHGELGTGNTSPVTTETRVAPPGTVKVTCN